MYFKYNFSLYIYSIIYLFYYIFIKICIHYILISNLHFEIFNKNITFPSILKLYYIMELKVITFLSYR